MKKPASEDQLDICRTKEGYPRDYAFRVQARMRKRDKIIVVPYHCDICKQWHLATPDSKRGKRRK